MREEMNRLHGQVAWGIAGSGVAAANIARALRCVPNARCVAVASRDVARAREFAKRFGISRVHASVADLASDGDVDVVFVATPNHLHARQSSSLLGHGKAVLCEKPFALGAREASEVASAARSAGRFCMEGLWTRFLPATREIEARVAAGDIGEPRLLVASLGMHVAADASPRRHDPEQGGGALLDFGVYALSLSSLFFGAPAEVSGRATFAPSGIDLAGELVLVHAQGAESRLSFSFERPLANDSWIFGTEGRIHVHPPLFRPEAFTLERHRGQAFRARTKSAVDSLLDTPFAQRASSWKRRLASALSRGTGHTLRFSATGNGLAHELLAAMECLRNGRTEHPRLPLSESVSILETIDRARIAFSTRASDGRS